MMNEHVMRYHDRKFTSDLKFTYMKQHTLVGEELSGSVVFRTLKPLFITGVWVELTVAEGKSLKKLNVVHHFCRVEIQKGCHLDEDLPHTWDFSFHLPLHLPPCSNTVIYDLKVVLTKKMKKHKTKDLIAWQSVDVRS
eukprot:TRINITY_DN9279_c0_g1_i1.p1 TRINITY_DN9279_c0_g1~~TRINITY_DN9279_c0_g1_i1.p1  ORF type:complete len:138 (+),score=12.44 TRINITY_DN9279_c0_g1_i1:266-679(+)